MGAVQKHSRQTRERVLKFIADAPLWKKVYAQTCPVKLSACAVEGRPPYAEAVRQRFTPIQPGHRFAPVWSTHWIKVEGVIPADWKNQDVRLLWDSSSEACVWEKGVPRQGLTGTGHPAWASATTAPIRPEYVVTRKARGGERVALHVEVACNHLFGLDHAITDIGVLRRAELAVFHRAAWDLHFDFSVLAELAEHLPPDSPRGAQALFAANAFINALDVEDASTWPGARRIARAFLAARNGEGQHNVSAIGHAHIDTAWLWPLAETKRKCYRSFSSVLRVMEEYPDFKFACSQAHQYAWIKSEQPSLYREIQQRARQGRFIPVGGTWIEPDCNIPSGESLVRQFLFGQRFFKEEFGRYCEGFWNPDVFGYNGQLPQIIRGAGMHWFLTQKLSWNQMNKPDAHTFWWEGIDGSRVLTHFPPTDTYNGVATVKELLFHVRNYKDLDRSNESYYLFGFGDGGGGPTREMMERLRRAKDSDGLPRVTVRTPGEFFKRLEADAKPLVDKVGELYLEVHRGTLTTQAFVKRDNRRSEELLHDVELLAAMGGGTYPKKELDRLWKILLLNQFHDIIPGSSIREVYEDAARDYRDLLGSAEPLRDRLVAKQAGKKGPRALVLNTLSHARREVVERPGGGLAVAEAPALGYAVMDLEDRTEQPVRVTENRAGFVLENTWIKARVDRKGRVVDVLDKQTGRSVLQEPGNRMALYDDNPNQFEAWDIDVFHHEKKIGNPVARACEVAEQTPLRVSIRFEYTIGRHSRMTQWIRVDAVRPLIEFETEVDWNETRRLLKVEFPTTLRADQATYEMQFGHMQRPTHYNSSHDLARFEVCAHRWADLSEPGCGLALINDSKYGHSVYRHEMRLTLLRSPLYPDASADRGRHTFRYAIMPHGGDWRRAGIMDQAAAFNQPLQVCPTTRPATRVSWFNVDQPAVRVDTVKRAEDKDAVVLRLVELHGSRVRATLTAHQLVKKAWSCNLLEEDRKPLRMRDGVVPLSFRPFEIKTIMVQL